MENEFCQLAQYEGDYAPPLENPDLQEESSLSLISPSVFEYLELHELMQLAKTCKTLYNEIVSGRGAPIWKQRRIGCLRAQRNLLEIIDWIDFQIQLREEYGVRDFSNSIDLRNRVRYLPTPIEEDHHELFLRFKYLQLLVCCIRIRDLQTIKWCELRTNPELYLHEIQTNENQLCEDLLKFGVPMCVADYCHERGLKFPRNDLYRLFLDNLRRDHPYYSFELVP